MKRLKKIAKQEQIYKTYFDFPDMTTFENKTYYKMNKSQGETFDLNNNIAVRYTDDINGSYNKNIPVYVNSYGETMWD